MRKSIIIFRHLWVALMLILALPAKSQNSYMSEFWADKEIVQQINSCQTEENSNWGTTVALLPTNEYTLDENEDYGMLVYFEAIDGVVWYGWDLGYGFTLQDESTNHGHSLPDSIQFKTLDNDDGACLHNLSTSGVYPAEAEEEICHECQEEGDNGGDEENTAHDYCACCSASGFCGCGKPYFEISALTIPSYLYPTIHIIIYKYSDNAGD